MSNLLQKYPRTGGWVIDYPGYLHGPEGQKIDVAEGRMTTTYEERKAVQLALEEKAWQAARMREAEDVYVPLARETIARVRQERAKMLEEAKSDARVFVRIWHKGCRDLYYSDYGDEWQPHLRGFLPPLPHPKAGVAILMPDRSDACLTDALVRTMRKERPSGPQQNDEELVGQAIRATLEEIGLAVEDTSGRWKVSVPEDPSVYLGVCRNVRNDAWREMEGRFK